MAGDAVAAWERRSQWPLALLALLFLGAWAWPILDPVTTRPWARWFDGVQWAVWVAFVGDYLARLWLADSRMAFARRNLFDLVVILVPLLRPLRLLRLVTLLHILNRSATASLRGRVVAYVVGGSALLAFVGGTAILDVERGAEGANIVSAGDAFWWACTTMTTVGYGDRFPVTSTGRLVAVGLMLGGTALLGSVTATLASWMTERVAEGEQGRDDAMLAELRELRSAVARLERDGQE